MNDKTDLQAQLEQIEQPGGQHHERWLKGDSEIQELRAGLYKRLYPEPAEDPPPHDPDPAEQKQGPETVSDPDDEIVRSLEDEKRIGLEELKSRWGEGFEGKLKDAYAVRDFVFHDRAGPVFEQINVAVGSDPDFIDRLATLRGELGDRLQAPAAVDLSGMSRQEQESKVIAVTQFLLGDLRSPLAQRVLQAVGEDPDNRFFNWALILGVKIFGR